MAAFTARKLGWRRDRPKPMGARPDHDAALTLGTAPPPAEASDRQWVVNVLDQAQAGTCVGHAIPQAVRMAHRRAGIPDPVLMSRLFGYQMSRAEDGEEDSPDEGTYLRSFFQALNALGFCPEPLWPYDLDTNDVPLNLHRRAPAACYRAAFDQRSPTVYQRIMTAGAARVDDIKRAIAAGYGVCFGTEVSEAFCANDFDPAVPLPPPEGQAVAGGHALCGAEYDPRGLRGPNSWSEGWGDKGWYFFSWEYMEWTQTNDLWIVAQAPNYSEVIP